MGDHRRLAQLNQDYNTLSTKFAKIKKAQHESVRTHARGRGGLQYVGLMFERVRPASANAARRQQVRLQQAQERDELLQLRSRAVRFTSRPPCAAASLDGSCAGW